MLRIALYLVGIIVLALGITLKTKTNLGVSPFRTLWHRFLAMKQERQSLWRI